MHSRRTALKGAGGLPSFSFSSSVDAASFQHHRQTDADSRRPFCSILMPDPMISAGVQSASTRLPSSRNYLAVTADSSEIRCPRAQTFAARAGRIAADLPARHPRIVVLAEQGIEVVVDPLSA